MNNECGKSSKRRAFHFQTSNKNSILRAATTKLSVLPTKWGTIHHSFFCFLGVEWNWAHFTEASKWPIVPAPDRRRWVWGSRWMFGRGNWRTSRKPVSVPLCPPQILHDLNRARTRAAAVGSRRLTSWATAQLLRYSSPVWSLNILTVLRGAGHCAISLIQSTSSYPDPLRESF
jgi:hypothetical protein